MHGEAVPYNIGEVKNGLDRVTVVTSIPIPRYSDIEIRPIVLNNCTEDLWRHGARTRGYPQHETYVKCNRVLAQATRRTTIFA